MPISSDKRSYSEGKGGGVSEKEETFCTLTDTQVLIPIALTKKILKNSCFQGHHMLN